MTTCDLTRFAFRKAGYKQQQMQICLFKKRESINLSPSHIFGCTEEFLELLGKSIPSNFKIKKQEWNVIKNSLFKCVHLTFGFL